MRDLLLIDYFKKISVRERLILVYFAISLILVLGLSEETPILLIIAVVGNFGNAARLINGVTLPPEDD